MALNSAPEVLEALAPAIERGHHLAVLAGEGAGLSRLYARTALRDLAEAGAEGRALVLTATADRAQRCARGMVGLLAEAGLDVLAVSRSGAEAPGAEDAGQVVVGTPAALLERMRSGRLSGASIRLIALDDVAALEPAWPAVEALLQATADGARRIAVTASRDERFDRLLEHQLPRGRRWPLELFEPPEGEVPRGELLVAQAATRPGRLARLLEELHRLADDASIESVTVTAADEDAAAEIEVALAVEGFQLAEPGEPGVRLTVLGDGEAATGAWVMFELPTSLSAFLESAGDAAPRAIVDPRHVPQLELLARRGGWSTSAAGDPVDPGLLDEVEAFRAHVGRAISEADLAAGALLLAPLIEEHGAVRVAAALADLLRHVELGVSSAGDGPRTEGAADRAARPAWTKVFVNIGRKDGAGPGDLVGAITGETGVAAGQIGRIDIRQTYTLIDVDSLVADRVVKGLAGSRIKGRDVTARLDRGRR